MTTDADVIRFIRDYTAEHSYPPSVREICAATGNTESTIHFRLRRMIREGKISRPPGPIARAITVTEDGMKYISTPLEQM